MVGLRTKMIIVCLLLAPIFMFSSHAGAFSLFGDPSNANGPCSDTSNTTIQNSPLCSDSTKNSTNNPVTDTIKKVANIIVIIAGVAAVITIIISGFMFITAGGSIAGQRAGDNPAKAAKAKSALSASLVGLVVVALAWTIVTFVTDKFIH